MADEAFPQRRKPPPHLASNRFGPDMVFLTVCTKERKPILAEPDVHDLLTSAWGQAGQWLVGKYVVMQDHIHLFCAPASSQSETLERWVTRWKAATSRRWPRRAEQPVWQSSHFSHRLRSGEDYRAKWEYVDQNPVLAKLVEEPGEWPFKGEMHKLRF